MISVSHLTKRFGAVVAVDRLSFEIQRGEVVGFLGPNGAGKTTAIRVLTGYHPATSGTAVLAGHDVATASLQVRQNVGYLPQEVPIYPDLRVIEYLRYRAALKGVPAKARAQAVARAMDKAGICEVARKLVGQVSHGYRQRVGLADALVSSPPILILDEPTSGLDPNQRLRIKQVVRELASEHTILFSSHILSEVQEVSSRVLIIHRGRLRADGPPGQLAQKSVPSRLFVSAVAGGPQLVAELAKVPGVAVAQLAAHEGVATAVADVQLGSDPLPAVGRALYAAGIAVLQLRLDLPTLEAYFQSITEGAQDGEQGEQQQGGRQEAVA